MPTIDPNAIASLDATLRGIAVRFTAARIAGDVAAGELLTLALALDTLRIAAEELACPSSAPMTTPPTSSKIAPAEPAAAP